MVIYYNSLASWQKSSDIYAAISSTSARQSSLPPLVGDSGILGTLSQL